MSAEKSSFVVSDSAGTVSAALMVPGRMRALFVFAHGAGAGMDHPFMRRLSEVLASSDVGTLRFNFPYMERGSKRPDPAPIAERACLKAIESARKRFPDIPLFAGGKSFGGRMTSQALVKEKGLVKGVIFVGFPLHPAGKPGTSRAEHLLQLTVPMLFLQGTRDALATIDLMEPVCANLAAATLFKFEGADHSFKAGKDDLIPKLGAAIDQWISAIIQP